MTYESESARILKENMSGWVVWSAERGWLDESEEEYVASCPVCGSPIDYCQGHGDIGDPAGARILKLHDIENHTECHPDGCDEAGTYWCVTEGKYVRPDTMCEPRGVRHDA